MNSHILLLAVGCLLIVIAVLGGGIEARAIRVPKISVWPRILAGVIGSFFLVLAFSIAPELLPKQPITFQVTDELGEGQVSEQVHLLIAGKEVGDISVNEHYPSATITVSVPGEGRYQYSLTADARFLDDTGELQQLIGTGQGEIDVRRGKVFTLEGTISGETWLAHLKEVQ